MPNQPPLRLCVSAGALIESFRLRWASLCVVILVVVLMGTDLGSSAAESAGPAVVTSITSPNPAPSATAPSPTNATLVVEISGRVEVMIGNAPSGWQPARARQVLRAGDRIRTRADSRAAVQLADRSVVRLDQNSTMIIREPVAAGAQKRFLLDVGRLFFLNRERPADVEFETPIAVGAIRGTEFLLAVEEGTGATRLALFDGAVHLESPVESLDLAKGQEAFLPPGQRARLTAVLPVAAAVQWAFYYPAVLDPREVALTETERATYQVSLTNYLAGDLLGALAQFPAEPAPASRAARVYLAALKLAVGQIEAARALLEFESEPTLDAGGRALTELMLAVASPVNGPLPTAEPQTASEWLARSHRWQSLSRLGEAREAARRATLLSPEFGPGWVRLAELELSFADRHAARLALGRGRARSPRHAQGLALEGFTWLEDRRAEEARQWFDLALELDPALGNAWLGRGLSEERLGNREQGRRDLQVAASLEPQRALFRSYLGKAFAESGADALAVKELRLARELDPADPTAWFYAGLHDQQVHRYNDAVRDLERSVTLNDGRSLFRSRLLLDQDRAMRSADLALVYDQVGMTEVGQRAASRAVDASYLDFSGHLFLARALQSREDPARFDLRWETARQSEWLVANLLAPPGAGNLSQNLSQQDYLRYFEPRPFSLSSLTEYQSVGGWHQSAAGFGSVGGLDYAVDAAYVSDPGHLTRDGFEQRRFSVQAKQRVTLDDDVYFQAGWSRAESGDVAQHYAPAELTPGLRAVETQEPHLAAGWHHAWTPASHLLVLAAHYDDHLSLDDPRPDVLFVRRNQGAITGVQTTPFLDLSLESDYQLNGLEAQQIWEGEAHDWIMGARLQGGEIQTQSDLRQRLNGLLSAQELTGRFEREGAYLYHRWKPLQSLSLIAGLAYDHVRAPVNADLPPLARETETHELVQPKVGVTWTPWTGGEFRAAYSRSLGGLYFDNSVRLEPAQLAGFTSAYRSLIPESVAGLVPGTEFETLGFGFAQAFPTGTYLGIEFEQLSSEGERGVGALTNGSPLPVADTPDWVRQRLEFTERSVGAYVVQLLDRDWSIGARARWSEAELEGRFPGLPEAAAGAAELGREERARLGRVAGFLRWNHPSGWFAAWQSEYWWQTSEGYEPARPDEAFWQHDVTVGYRLARRRAEVRASVLNLTDEEYRLNPLNLHPDLARGRTLVLGLRLNF